MTTHSNTKHREYKRKHFPRGKGKKNVWQIPRNSGQSLIQFCSHQVSKKKKPAKQQFQKIKTIESAKVVTAPLNKWQQGSSIDGRYSAKVRLSPRRKIPSSHPTIGLISIEHFADRKKYDDLLVKLYSRSESDVYRICFQCYVFYMCPYLFLTCLLKLQ